MDQPRFNPGGRPHRMLGKLMDGPASQKELADLIRRPEQSMISANARAHRCLAALHSRRFVDRRGQQYAITPAGQDYYLKLGDLRPRPNVRVFVKEEARG